MSETILFGIKNCDTMKKAFKWLEGAGVCYRFHDYKKDGVDRAVLVDAIAAHGVDIVINKRGTTWRKLPDDIKNTLNDENAIDLAAENPSILKRPLLLHKDQTYIGFKEAEYADIFA